MPQEVCEEVLNEVCRNVPTQKCAKVPEKVCSTVPTEKCEEVLRQQCALVGETAEVQTGRRRRALLHWRGLGGLRGGRRSRQRCWTGAGWCPGQPVVAHQVAVECANHGWQDDCDEGELTCSRHEGDFSGE